MQLTGHGWQVEAVLATGVPAGVGEESRGGGGGGGVMVVRIIRVSDLIP